MHFRGEAPEPQIAAKGLKETLAEAERDQQYKPY